VLSGALAGLATSLIWGTVIFYYKKLMLTEPYVSLNLRRVASAAALSIPLAALQWNTDGFVYAFLSGIMGLGVGDTLYLLAIKISGASVAAPVAYTYVILAQIVAPSFGEKVGARVLLAAVLAFAGTSLISVEQGNSARREVRGVILAFLAGCSWMASSFLIKLSMSMDARALNVAFFRLLGALAFLLGINAILYGKRAFTGWPKRDLLPAVSLLDMLVGAALYSLTVHLVGVSRAVILLSLSPAITIGVATALRLERVGLRKGVGASLIVTGIALSAS